jgi:GNAT superfamily N-acetyltransferase
MEQALVRRFEETDIAWLVDQHQALYAQDEGFDDSFGPLVASILSDFNARHDPSCERGWIAERAGQRLGSIFCVRQAPGVAKLRLFLLTPEARGQGLGKRLLRICMDYARACGYGEIRLWTHESHTAACALYAAHGWDLTDSKPVHSFGQDLIEQSWRVTL